MLNEPEITSHTNWALTPALAVLALMGVLALGQQPSMAQQADQHQVWQQRSEQRDRAYVRLLLQRGTPEEKIASRLSLTTQFARLNPDGDLQAYVQSIIDEEKSSSQAPKQRQSQSQPPTVTSPIAASGVLLQTTSVQASGSTSAQSGGAASSSNATDTSGQSAADNSQGPGPGPLGPGPGCNLFPAPPSTGASVPLSYFGPPPSDTNPSFAGPFQLLKSGTVDITKGTITLPLYLGHMKDSGKNVWYILTDVDDPNVAAELGLNFSPKLTFAANGARTANFDANNFLVFDKGTVDFSPNQEVVPGPPDKPFPPQVAKPGAVGDADYSPLVRVLNAGGVTYNAPIVAFGVDASQINFPDGNVDYSKVHDEVVAIDPNAMTVTIQGINGFSFGRQLWYISMDSSIPLAAAIERNTFAPLLQNLVTGRDDSFSSPVERLFIAVNGPRNGGCQNSQRQGLFATLTDGHRPNNTFGGIPTLATDYSPMWNAQLYEWTPSAVAKDFRGQLREEFDILTLVQDGVLTGPDGAPFGDSKFIVNCPPIQRLE
jgi:hypothetical protein